MDSHLAWQLPVLYQAPQANPVAGGFGGETVWWAWVAVCAALLTLALIAAVALELVPLGRFKRRRYPPRDHIDPEQVEPLIPELEPMPEYDDWPIPPWIGMLSVCTVLIMWPALGKFASDVERLAAALIGLSAVFLVSMHLEVRRRPEYRPRIVDALPLDPQSVPRLKPNPGARAPDPCPTHPEWLVVGAIVVALCGIGPVLGEMIGSLSPPATRDNFELELALDVFVLFIILFCATPLIDRWTSRRLA